MPLPNQTLVPTLGVGFGSPIDLKSVVLYWDVGDPTGLYNNTGRTLLAGQGESAAGVTDRSSAKNHGSTAANGALVSFGHMGGRPALTFDGTNHLLSATNNITLSAGYYIAFWGILEEAAATTPIFGQTATGTPLIRYISATSWDYRGDAGNLNTFTTAAGADVSEPSLWEFTVLDGGSLQIMRNRVSIRTTGTNPTDTTITIRDFAARLAERGAWTVGAIVVANAEQFSLDRDELYTFWKNRFAPHYQEIKATAPYIYYPMWEGRDTPVRNHGNTSGWNGTYSAGDIAGAVKFIDEADAPLLVAADTDRINWYNAAITSALDFTECTVSLWFQYPTNAVWNDTNTRYLWYVEPNSDASHEFFVAKASSSTTTVHNITYSTTRAGTTDSETVNIAGLGFVAGEWVNVIITVSETADQMRLFINGTQRGSARTTLGAWAPTWNQTNQTVIGASSTTPAATEVLGGGYHHFAFWNRVLAAAEITNIGAGPAPLGQVAQLQRLGPLSGHLLEEGSGTTAQALVNRTAYDGTHNGGVTVASSPSPFSGRNAPRYDGVNGTFTTWYNASLATALATAMANNFTMSAWVKIPPDEWLRGASAGRIVSVYADDNNQAYLGLNTTNRYTFYYRAGATVIQNNSTSSPAGNSAWHHVAMTVNVAADEQKSYVDGVLIGTLTGLGVWAGTPTSGGVMYGTWLSTNNPFDGWIARPAFYNRTLSDYEIKLLAAGKTFVRDHDRAMIDTDALWWWKLNNTSGTTATETINGHHGTYTGVTLNATAGPAGISGRRVPLFDTVGDFINIHSSGLSSAFDGKRGAVSIWVKGSGVGWLNNTNRAEFIRITPPGSGYSIRIRHTNIANVVQFRYEVNSVAYDFDYTFSFEPLGWLHFVLAYSDNAGDAEMRCYVNGVLVGTVGSIAHPWTPTSLDSTRTIIGNNSTTGSETLLGYVSDAAIFGINIAAAVKDIFDLGYAPEFTPADLTTQLWYDFSDTTTLYQDTSRQQPVVNSGEGLRGVTDLSGNANHGSTSASEAKYIPNGQNGRSIARFASGERIDFPLVTLGTGYYAIIAVKFTDWTAHQAIFHRVSGNGFLRIQSNQNTWDTVGTADPGGTNKTVGWGTPNVGTGWRVIEFEITSGKVGQFYMDGRVYGTPGSGYDGTIEFQRLGFNIVGDVGEAILISGNVSATNRKKLVEYLRNKWGFW